MFPSIFYEQLEDGSVAGALPFLLNQGFRLIGWFKPAKDDETGVTAGTFSFHICAMMPVTELTAAQRRLAYGHPGVDGPTFFGPGGCGNNPSSSRPTSSAAAAINIASTSAPAPGPTRATARVVPQQNVMND